MQANEDWVVGKSNGTDDYEEYSTYSWMTANGASTDLGDAVVFPAEAAALAGLRANRYCVGQGYFRPMLVSAAAQIQAACLRSIEEYFAGLAVPAAAPPVPAAAPAAQ